jgi:hypothetical protein
MGYRLAVRHGAVLNLSPQEAYYWNYSIHPAVSYLDHPPMVAWVVRAGTLLLRKSAAWRWLSFRDLAHQGAAVMVQP